MKVPLHRIDTYVINLDHQKERASRVRNELRSIGQMFQFVSAHQHTIANVGCSKSHLSVLDKMKRMSLVLEDDVRLTRNPIDVINIPDGTDAIYLGVSSWGYVRGYDRAFEGAVMCSRWDDEYKRVLNMCSTHAILYVSQRYIEHSIETMLMSLDEHIASDLLLASHHKDFNILTPNSPMFYQETKVDDTYLDLEC